MEARLLGLVVALRVLLDLVPGLPSSVGSVVLLAVCLVVGARGTGQASWWPAALPWLALLAVGALRGEPEAAIRSLSLLAWPVAMVWAASRVEWTGRTVLEALALPVLAGALPVALSLVAWAMGQPAEHVLHDWPRLIGAYGNLHSHAVAMAMIVCGGLAASWLWAQDGHHLGRIGSQGALAWFCIAGLAACCLAGTWVRTLFLFVGLFVAAAMASHGGWRTWVLSGLAVVGALVFTPLGARMGDLASVLTWTEPPGGWGSIGSWRGVIWEDSIRTFLAGPSTEIWLGRGLGGQYGLHRHLDPHSELLSLWFQLGPLGVVAYAGLALVWMRGAWRSRNLAGWRGRVAWLALWLWSAALLTAPLSNDWLLRPTATVWVALITGIALRSER